MVQESHYTVREVSVPMIALRYVGRPGALEFRLGDRRPQCVELSNVASAEAALPVLFKIQCTSSKKFRVRPILGLVVPGEAAQVQLQLAPQVVHELKCSSNYCTTVMARLLSMRACPGARACRMQVPGRGPLRSAFSRS